LFSRPPSSILLWFLKKEDRLDKSSKVWSSRGPSVAERFDFCLEPSLELVYLGEKSKWIKLLLAAVRMLRMSVRGIHASRARKGERRRDS
jgi:hypothetical protein